ncbi:transaldolase [Candidatus Blochmanniella vafra str. BVAF]|uniref:Transaldolase n=1 Tax=Blochmanniella vafra (strain BVAF) TaxID=859654 RepID=E8Q774_BLOVB|nr:transaldolase family protein [Candidatus Blochmannia vafer]ADV33898.1 transaldolase [Candidatus Blochmannia vafer str. BVAF]
MNQLDILKKIPMISSNTEIIEDIVLYKIQYTITHHLLLSVKSPLFTISAILFEDNLNYTHKLIHNPNKQVINASHKCTVNIRSKILKKITECISFPKINTTLFLKKHFSIQQAYKLIKIYQEKNTNTSLVLTKIKTTWKRIKSTKKLEKFKIKYIVTSLFFFTQTHSYTTNNLYLISPFIVYIDDWYNKNNLLKRHYINNDPNVKTLKKNYHFYKTHYNIITMEPNLHIFQQILTTISEYDYLILFLNFLKEILYKNLKSVEGQLSPCNLIILNCQNPFS